MQSQTQELLLTLFINAFVFQISVVTEGAILLVYLCIFCHNRTCLTVFWVSQDQVESGRSSKDALSYELFIFNEIPFFTVNIRLQEDETTIDVAWVEELFDKKQNLIKGKLIGPCLHTFFRLEKFRILNGEEVMCSHFKRQKKKGKTKNCPVTLAFHFNLEIFKCFHHHSIHFTFHQSVHLDRIHSSKNRPIGQMQKNTYKLGIFLTLHYFKGSVHIFLLENQIAETLLWFFLWLLDLFWLLEKGAEGMAIGCFLLGRNGKNGRWKLLIVFVKESSNFCEFSVDWSLQFLENLYGELYLCEWEVEDPCLIDYLRIFMLAFHESWSILQLIVDFASEILIKGENVTFLNAADVEIQYLQVNFLFLCFFFFLLLGRRRSTMIVYLLLQFHWLQVQYLKHLTRNRLTLHLFRQRIISSLCYDCDSVCMQPAVQSALDYITIFQGIFLEYLVYVFLGGLDSQIFEVSGGVLLLKDLEKSRVLDIQLFAIGTYLDVKNMVLGHFPPLPYTHNNITYNPSAP